MASCPTEEEWAAYVAGATAERQRLSEHLQQCAQCRARLVHEQSNQDWLRNLRRATTDSETVMSLSPDVPLTAPPADQNLDVHATPAGSIGLTGYHIVRELGTGGQSIIYEAIQESTGQRVAVKVPREGRYITKAERRRFEREIELVAQLKHPDIISIFDSGLTDDGRKYYVMDYVEGRHLHHYVRQTQLPLDSALALFARVCEAVQFAHQRGVIHRDLKPANILVDAAGNPKILDFGLARVSGPGTETAVSMSRELLGTLPYMSPEQTRGDAQQIDTRTDVYALGVVLYELLTGQYPYPVTGSVVDIVRSIGETEPVPPIRRWRPDLGISSPRAGGGCPIDHEMHTIVMKALAKDCDRRYQSAREFAADIRRYLAGEPVEAKADSSWYVLRKTLWQHRVAATVAGGFILMLAVFGAVTAGLWQRASTEASERTHALQAVDVLLGDELEKLRAASTVDALRWLRAYQNIAAAKGAGMAFAQIRANLNDLERAVVDKIENDLATNDLDELVAALRTNADMRAALTELNQRSYGRQIQDRLLERFANSLFIPLPGGRLQHCLDIIRLNQQLNAAAGNPPAVQYDPLAAATASCERVILQDFDRDPLGETPPGWVGLAPVAKVVEAAESRAFRVGSTLTDAPGMRYVFDHPITAPYVCLQLKARFVDSPGNTTPAEAFAAIGFVLGNGSIPGCRLIPAGSPRSAAGRNGSEIRLDHPRLDDGAKKIHEIHLLIDRERDVYDIIVDRALAIENLELRASHAVVGVQFSTHGGARVDFDDLRVDAGQIPLKLDLGPVMPVATAAEEHFRLVPLFYLGTSASTLALQDIDNDGQSELIVGGQAPQAAQLQLWQFNRHLYRAELRGTIELPQVRVATLRPIGGTRLSVWGYEETHDGETSRGFGLLDIAPNLSFTWLPLRTYARLDDPRAAMDTVSSTNGQRGLVVGLRHYTRTFEFFRPTDDDDAYISLGQHPVHGPGMDGMIDIVSIAACDADSDGVDDCVFLGLGPFEGGWRPAIVTMTHGLLDPRSTPQIRPLTADGVGWTQVAVSNLNTTQPHLIATARAVGAGDAGQALGVRVWPAAALLGERIPDPLRPEQDPQNIHALAVGSVAGLDVFAVATRALTADGTCINYHLRLYTLTDERIELLAQTTLFDVGCDPIQQIALADLDANGNDELIILMQPTGVLTCAIQTAGARNHPSPAPIGVRRSSPRHATTPATRSCDGPKTPEQLATDQKPGR